MTGVSVGNNKGNKTTKSLLVELLVSVGIVHEKWRGGKAIAVLLLELFELIDNLASADGVNVSEGTAGERGESETSVMFED